MEPLTRQQIARKQDWMDRYLRARRREALTARTLEEARSAAARVSPVLDGMPRPGGHSDRVPPSAERLAEAEHAHNIALAEMRQARGEVQQAVGSVRDRTGREVSFGAAAASGIAGDDAGIPLGAPPAPPCAGQRRDAPAVRAGHRPPASFT